MAVMELYPLLPQLLLATGALLILIYASITPDSENHGILAGITTLFSLAAFGTAMIFLMNGNIYSKMIQFFLTVLRQRV